MEKRKVTVDFKDSPSLTQQHLKDSTNVNSILEKYRKTGQISHVRKSPGMYGDFTQLGDFRKNLEVISQAQNSFNQLPSHLRKRFGNDPALLVDFLSDQKNYDEAEKMGFVVRKQQPQPQNDDKTTINSADPKPAI